MGILKFGNNSISNNNTPVSPGLELFDSTLDLTTIPDNLFIDRIIITSSGSGYSSPLLNLTMISGSVEISASAFFTLTTDGTGSLDSIRLTSSGRFSMDTKISGSIDDASGIDGTVYISTSRTKNANIFLAKKSVYDSFVATKDKIRLLLYTRKGEIPMMPEFGTTVYEKLLKFEQVNSIEEFINECSLILAKDIEEQISEVEVLNIINNESETDLDKNKIGISLIFRHKLLRKTGTMDINVVNDTVNLIREYYTTENEETRAIRYLR